MPNFLDNIVETDIDSLCSWAIKYNALLSELQTALGSGSGREFLLRAGDTVPEDFFIARSEFNPGEWIELRMKNAMGAEIFLGRYGEDDFQHGLIVNGSNRRIFPVGDAKMGYYWPYNNKSWDTLELSEFTSKGTLFRAELQSDLSGFVDLSPYVKSREFVLIIDNMTGDLTIFDHRIADGCKLVLYPYQYDSPVHNLLLQKPATIKFRNNSSLTVSRPNPNELSIGIPQNNNILIESQMVNGIAFVEIKEYQ